MGYSRNSDAHPGQHQEQQEQEQQDQQPLHFDQPHHESRPQTIMPAQRSEDDSGLTPIFQGHGNSDEFEQRALLTSVLNHPYAVQTPAPLRRISVSSASVNQPPCGVPTGACGSRRHTVGPVDHGEQSGSHGTLMLSKGGRSKYLGPTAGTEWLKDVRLSKRL